MIVALTKQNVDSFINGDKPIVVDVFATWCGPCMQMKPHFEKLAQEYEKNYVFASLNVDEARELAIHFNVTSVPTFLFIKNKIVVGREVGYMPIEDLKSRMLEYLT